MLAIAAWIMAGLPNLRQTTTKPMRLLWILLLWQLVIWIRISYGNDVLNAEVAFNQSMTWFIIAAFIATVIIHPPPLRWLLLALAVGVMLQAMIGIAQVWQQSSLGIQSLTGSIGIRELTLDPQVSGVSVVQAEGQRLLRPYGISSHPNILSGYAVIGCFAALGLWRWKRGVALICLVGAGWLMLLTFSRAAFGGVVIGGVVWSLLTILAHDWKPYRAVILIALGVGLIFTAVYAPYIAVRYGFSAPDDTGETSTFEEFSAANRQVYLEQAAQLSQDHPWRGVGIGNFAWESAWLLDSDWRDMQGDHVHHMYWLVRVELGWIGFGLFVGLLLLTCVSVALHLRQQTISPMLRAVVAAWIAWLGMGFFDHYFWSQMGMATLLFLLMVIIVAGEDHLTIDASHEAGKKIQNPSLPSEI